MKGGNASDIENLHQIQFIQRICVSIFLALITELIGFRVSLSLICVGMIGAGLIWLNFYSFSNLDSFTWLLWLLVLSEMSFLLARSYIIHQTEERVQRGGWIIRCLLLEWFMMAFLPLLPEQYPPMEKMILSKDQAVSVPGYSFIIVGSVFFVIFLFPFKQPDPIFHPSNSLINRTSSKQKEEVVDEEENMSLIPPNIADLSELYESKTINKEFGKNIKKEILSSLTLLILLIFLHFLFQCSYLIYMKLTPVFLVKTFNLSPAVIQIIQIITIVVQLILFVGFGRLNSIDNPVFAMFPEILTFSSAFALTVAFVTAESKSLFSLITTYIMNNGQTLEGKLGYTHTYMPDTYPEKYRRPKFIDHSHDDENSDFYHLLHTSVLLVGFIVVPALLKTLLNTFTYLAYSHIRIPSLDIKIFGFDRTVTFITLQQAFYYCVTPIAVFTVERLFSFYSIGLDIRTIDYYNEGLAVNNYGQSFEYITKNHRRLYNWMLFFLSFHLFFIICYYQRFQEFIEKVYSSNLANVVVDRKKVVVHLSKERYEKNQEKENPFSLTQRIGLVVSVLGVVRFFTTS